MRTVTRQWTESINGSSDVYEYTRFSDRSLIKRRLNALGIQLDVVQVHVVYKAASS